MDSMDAPKMPDIEVKGDPIKTGNWKHSLFGCFDNMGVCIVTYFLPCVTFGQLAELHREDCKLYGALYLIPFLNCYVEAGFREKIRFRRGVIGTFIEDLLIIVCCPPCALAQEMQEMQDIIDEQARLGASSTSPANQPYGTNPLASQAAPLPSQSMNRE